MHSVEGCRFQPTLKRSACRTVFQICEVQLIVSEVQVMIAGRYRRLTEVYFEELLELLM